MDVPLDCQNPSADLIAVKQVSQGPQYRSFTLAAAADPGSVGNNPIRQAGEGEALEQYRSGAPESGEEKSFTTEKHGFQAAGPLDVIVDSAGEGDNTAGIHPQLFIDQFFGDDGAAGVDEGHAVASQALEDKPFTTEKAGSQSFGECNTDFSSQGSA